MNRDYKLIEEKKQSVLNILSKIKREGIEDLKAFLEDSDFFSAPASTRYHLNVEGGLCEHSLNVLSNLMTLAEIYTPGMYEEETLFIVSLFHDISKTNFYEESVRNKKVYSHNGSKRDEMGYFDWVAVKGYGVKEASERLVAGTHGYNSVMILQRYITLTEEEQIAILNHHGGMDDMSTNRDMTAIYNRFPLVTLLHLADMLATYIDERIT